MAVSDALVVEGDWISEYYFTSDATSGTFLARTLELTDSWKQQEKETPTWRSPLTAVTAARRDLLRELGAVQELVSQGTGAGTGTSADGALPQRSASLARRLHHLLGYTDETDHALRWDIDTPGTEDAGALRLLGLRSVAERPLALVDALAAENAADVLAKHTGHLTAPVTLHADTPEEQTVSTVPALLSALAIDEHGPAYMLVLAGRHAILTSADMWPQGRYLTIDLQTVLDRGDTKRGGEMQRALVCLAADALAPDETGAQWWDATREQSVANAVGVSEDLRDGVRDSIEVIANEVVERRRAQHLEPLADAQAQPLALQALRYLYRILFLLHAEASPELGILPVGAPEYESGYSVDRLREMTQQPLPAGSSDGTYLYESLHRLAELVQVGHAPGGEPADAGTGEETGGPATSRAGTLRVERLEADLFRPERTALIDEVRLGNAAVQRVLRNLMLSKEKRGKDRGFISYVALGINQLGAVYESLMSYTGSFAHEELVEVAKNGNPKDGSWVVPANTLDEDLKKHVVTVEDPVTGEAAQRRYRHGQFVFRLSGRERQQSASYYSPEVLTRFTVSQGLAELLDPIIEGPGAIEDSAEQKGVAGTDEAARTVEDSRTFEDRDFDGNRIIRRATTAQQILEMTVCEPALGSGAFAIEAVRQLAEQYLQRRQDELGERIDPEQYAAELQRVKSYIALHNVYGVDLNPTAVELAEVSLWLDTMTTGLKAPWFGLRLRPGNSLIGARHALYPRKAVEDGKLKDVISGPPTALPLHSLLEDPAADGKRSGVSSRIFQFLLPGQGWGCAADDKEIKSLAPDAAKTVRTWARGLHRKPTKKQLDELENLTQRVEELWELALRRMNEAQLQSRRSIPVWGTETPSGGEVTRAEIERSLNDPNSAYQRLRLVMDAWCALWFWPVLEDDAVTPPDLDEWLHVVRKILGRTFEGAGARAKGSRRRLERQEGTIYLGASSDEWHALDEIESYFSAEGAARIGDLVESTPWLRRVRKIAGEQRFFHWELDFSPVFAATAGGFDLQVGNPPWVRPTLDVPALLGEFDPWWVLTTKPSENAKRTRRENTLSREGPEAALLSGTRDIAGLAEFTGSESVYPETKGTQPDLYRTFMARTWADASREGVVALVHPPTHLADARAYALRMETYRRLRRHWRFINDIKLFQEVDNHVEYSINIYSAARRPDFLTATGMYHPLVAEGSLRHSGAGPEPGYKDAEGHWDLTPHRGRIIHVQQSELELWHTLMEGGDSEIAVGSTRMLAVVNHASNEVLAKLAQRPAIGSLGPSFSSGWHESGARREGYFESRWGEPESWRDVILQGPYFHVGNPFATSRNETMGSNKDYTAVDLERLPADAKPITEYKPIYEPGPSSDVPDTSRYDRDYGTWVLTRGTDGKPLDTTPVRDHYRVMWRTMAASTGERTLIPAIYPPGPAHVDLVCCFGAPEVAPMELALLESSASSLLADYLIRSTVGKHIRQPEGARVPLLPKEHPLAPAALLRTLRLNCLTIGYAALWQDCFDPAFNGDSWTGDLDRSNRPALGEVGPEWTSDTPLRLAEDRRQALVEIDAIMAIATGVSIDELVTIYRTQFGVLNGYDRGEGRNAYIYDAHGRQIPTPVRTAWNKAGRPERGLSETDRTYVLPNPYGENRTVVAAEPFRILDREADLRQAYAVFAERMGHHHG